MILGLIRPDGATGDARRPDHTGSVDRGHGKSTHRRAAKLVRPYSRPVGSIDGGKPQTQNNAGFRFTICGASLT